MNQKEKAKRLLQQHDWFYDYSDNYRVWRAGMAHKRQMLNALCQLPQTDIDELWEKHAPKELRDRKPKSLI